MLEEGGLGVFDRIDAGLDVVAGSVGGEGVFLFLVGERGEEDDDERDQEDGEFEEEFELAAEGGDHEEAGDGGEPRAAGEREEQRGGEQNHDDGEDAAAFFVAVGGEPGFDGDEQAGGHGGAQGVLV